MLCNYDSQTIGHMYGRYLDIVGKVTEEGGTTGELDAFEALGLTRYCCRRMLLTHVDLIDKLMLYNRKSPCKSSFLLEISLPISPND
jgi:DNA-directed RNA polymerases I, II, and III subunit RPABC5